MPHSNDITVRFCLNKSAGQDLEITKFDETEIADFRKCLSLGIAYYPNDEDGAKILSIEILHDGITPAGSHVVGFFINREGESRIEGFPTPVVRFILDRATSEEDFLQSISETSYCINTELMKRNDEEPYFAEDHNGYSSILNGEERENFITLLKKNDSYCGKKFKYPTGIPECGHSIPALDFALTSNS